MVGVCCAAYMSRLGPLAGRDKPLRVLVDSVAPTGAGPGVVVLGEAGIGKTRLVAEARRVLQERGVTTVSGACLRMSSSMPFLPIVDVLQAIASLIGGDVMASALQACPDMVRSELSLLVPELGEDADVPVHVDDQWRRLRLFDSIRRLLAAVAGQVSLVVIVKDVHWADPSTVQLLDYLLAPGHRTGVPFVITGRLDETDSSWVESVTRAGLVRLELGLLDAVATRDEAGDLLGRPVTDAEAEQVYRRTGGHPFYVEQLVSASRSDDSAEIPAGLRPLLQARIAGAGEDERRLMALLSIAGRALDEAAIGLASGWTADHTEAVVRELRRRRLVAVSAGGCEIRHALLGEAVVEDMSGADRRALHRGAAESLARWDDQAVAAEVAEHWAQAGDASAELEWRVRAAQYSDAVAAPADAAGHWLRVIQLWTHAAGPPEQPSVSLPTVYRRANAALMEGGRQREAADLGEEALRLFDTADVDATERADIYLRVGAWRALVKDPSAIKLIREAVEIGRTLPASREKAWALFRLFRHLDILRNAPDDEQDELLAQALSVGRECRAGGIERAILGAQAYAAAERGRLVEAVTGAEAALQFPRDASDPELTAISAAIATDVLRRCGDYDAVIVAGLVEVAWVERHGYSAAAIGQALRGNVVQALRERGRVDEAIVIAASAENENPFGPIWADRALLRAVTGSPDRAWGVWRAGRKMVQNHSQLALARESTAAGVEIAIWAAHPDEALTDALPLLRAVTGTAEARVCGDLFVLAARACADLASHSRAVDNPGEVATALGAAGDLQELLAQCIDEPFDPSSARASAAADALSWVAELGRLQGPNHPDAWAAAATAWESFGAPHGRRTPCYARARRCSRHPTVDARRGRYCAAPRPLLRNTSCCRPLSASWLRGPGSPSPRARGKVTGQNGLPPRSA